MAYIPCVLSFLLLQKKLPLWLDQDITWSDALWRSSVFSANSWDPSETAVHRSAQTEMV